MKISMKIGPQQTDTSKFQGFGMKIGGSASSSTGPGRPGGLAKAKAKAAAATGGMSALFRESMDDDDDKAKQSSVPTWSKPTVEAVQAQRQAEALLAQDPSVFQYDEVIDDVKRDMDMEVPSQQQVRTDVMTQKKRVGLVLREGHEAVRVGSQREAKYVQKVIIATDRRKVEQQIVEDRLLKKEQDAREGREVFVTGAFKEELKRRKKFEEELEEQDRRDQRKDATKMEDGQGFADFHRMMLNGGLSSGRGGEKIVDRAAPRIDLPEDSGASVKKEDEEEEIKEESLKDEDKAMKTEDSEEKEEQHGVQDVAAPSAAAGSKKEKELEEQAQRAEKAMSAKERYLARKRAAESSA